MQKKTNLSQAKYCLISCTDCNALVSVGLLQKNQSANCPRCHKVLQNTSGWNLKRCAIIALTILILMPFALGYPLLTINLLGTPVNASVWQGIWKMAIQGYPYTAFMIFLCAVFMPISFALLVILLRLSQLLDIRPRHLLLTLNYLKPWVMFDVYLVALGVTMFKVQEYASLHINSYLIAFIFTALLTTLLFIKINPAELWRHFYPQKTPLQQKNLPIIACKHCEHTFNHCHTDRKRRPICPRCLSRLDFSDEVYLQRTWATLLAAVVMIIPANLLPMSIVYVNGIATEDTLMSGVLTFINLGSYFVAFVVFVASIFIPFSKILIMCYLLFSIHFKWQHSIHLQIRLLHFVHFVGRWSMLDLFVLALMMSLVTRGQLIDFSVGPAAFYFGATVFLTMMSTSQFDSRLLWNIYDKQKIR
ncbi:paraquat-inducible protein A [Histophilus somni]|uniref:paraquat-inducible protein A n=1 Tax=Histophilus somni TaxID=731 RepID=UPI00003976FE|nr:paraquat-inducible protein A [Histophilus somni]ACA31312.1 integral membrane protein, PqiA family [Histophilus somni 2336]QQF85341.1 paraquat-inducible protein A [Histophilus somni]QQJ90844.1 paraquat-inducible protein A [Histophilus somni]